MKMNGEIFAKYEMNCKQNKDNGSHIYYKLLIKTKIVHLSVKFILGRQLLLQFFKNSQKFNIGSNSLKVITMFFGVNAQNELTFSFYPKLIQINYIPHQIRLTFPRIQNNNPRFQIYKQKIIEMIVLNNVSRLKSYISMGLIGGGGLAALIIYLVLIGGNRDAIQFMTFTNVDFNYHVYCPIDTPQAANYYKQYFGGNYASQSSINSSRIYAVYIQSQNVTSLDYNTATNTYSNITDVGLFYCGLARPWNGTCQNSKLICSAPGPMFYLPVGQQVTIIWINNISSQGLAWAQDGCYSSDSQDSSCMIDAKIIDYQFPHTQGCTFNKPTNYSFPTRKVRVNKTQVPISPHIHGLETRPSFDGNPLSWFNNIGDRGVGYSSLNDTLYYYQFNKQDTFTSIPTYNQNINMKIIKAANQQPAGNLFYHDHAMKSTKFNVAHGLSGLYILYNKTAEQYLPKNTEEKFILFSHKNDGDLRDMAMSTDKPMPNKPHTDKIYTLNNGTDTYNRNMTYRFRILNGHYDNVYYNVTFAAYYNTVTLPNGKTSIQQINPFNLSFPLTNYLTKINFTIIGTDSALFNNPVSNISSVDMGVAQRVDLLIKFGSENGIPLGVNNFYLICYDYNIKDYVIKHHFKLDRTVSNNKYPDPHLTKPLNVPFYNLANIPKSQVAVNRMRPLLSRPSDTRFLINGHYMYDMGETDNPQIGTTQDWYIINNLFEPHPIHVHLVNFQIMQTFDLKKTPQGCTIYELDFFRFSNYSKFQNLNDSQLCYYLESITLQESSQLYDFLDSYNLETTITTANIGKVSGLNVMDPISTLNDRAKYAKYNSCSLNSIYKYVCEESTGSINNWQKRWKQTALVRQFTVMVLRIRWASTNYDEKIKPYPYFDIPEDQLMQFPGFVYHCHILPHQDNEMMRPFMLSPSQNYKQQFSKPTYPSYISKQANNLNSIILYPPTVPRQQNYTWYGKAKQINSFLNCPK